MASRKYYEATLKRFNAKYQIKVSIDAMVELQSSLSALEEEPAMIDYASLLSDVLKMYLDKNARIKESGTYGIPDFSLGEFIIDFEEVMEEKYRADLKAGQKPTREPYAGANLSDVFSFAGNLVKEYSKPLVSVWAGRIKKGVMSVDTMRAVTDGEYEKLMGIGGKLEQKVKGELDEETMKRLANVVAAREAMEKVRKSRGILWVLANLRINIREWKYMKQLRKACDDLKKNHFPVDTVARQLSEGKFIPESSFNAANLEKQTKPWLYGVGDRFKKLTNMEGYTSMLTFKLSDRLPNGKSLTTDKINELVEGAHEVNRYYDEDINSGVEPKQAILSSMKIIFKQAYQLTGSLSYTNISERLLAAQIITDFTLKELTAAGLKGNPFAEYANGYALKNPDEMITEIQTDIEEEGFDKETVLENFDDALMKWGPDDSKFNISIDEFDDKKSVERSPMHQPKQKQAPFISTNI